MQVVLTDSEFLIALALWLATLYVAVGLRSGLYFLFSRFVRYTDADLKQPSDKQLNESVGFLISTVALDTVLSWISLFSVIVSLVVIQFVAYNVVLHAISIFGLMVLGYIFPFRLWVRLYRWWTRWLADDEPFVWLIVWLGALVLSLVIFYVTFFSLIGVFYPFFDWLFGRLSVFSLVIIRQGYIQHIHAFVVVTGLSFLYMLVDMIRVVYRSHHHNEYD